MCIQNSSCKAKLYAANSLQNYLNKCEPGALKWKKLGKSQNQLFYLVFQRQLDHFSFSRKMALSVMTCRKTDLLMSILTYFNF